MRFCLVFAPLRSPFLCVQFSRQNDSYIKALDELKKLRKVQSDEAKLQRGVLEEKSKNRQLLESLREKQQNTALNIAKAERELEQLRAQLDQKEAEYRVVNLAVLEQGKVCLL